MTAVQVENLGWQAGEPCYRASCPGCGTTGDVRTSPVQAKAALVAVHDSTCSVAALPLLELTQ